MTTTPFKSAVLSYYRKGWDYVFPTVDGVPPKGVTGYQRSTPTANDIEHWRSTRGADNIGIGMPTNVIAIDVDRGKTDGADGWTSEIAHLIQNLLPVTYSNGHGVGPYRHYLYQVPEGVTAEDVAALAGGLGPGVDLIKWNHRWLRVAPSIHKSGEVYEWLDPSGEPCKAPSPEMLPVLSLNQWYAIKEIAGSVSSSGGYAIADVDNAEWVNSHAGEPDAEMKQAFSGLWSNATTGGRHDAALACTMRVCHLAEEGHPGARAVLKRLRREFIEQVSDDRQGGVGEAEEEWSRVLTSAIGKAVSKTEAGDRSAPIPEVTVLDNPFSRAGQDPAEDEDDDFEENPYPVTLASRPYDFVEHYVQRNHSDSDGRALLRYFDGGRWGRFREDVGHYVLASDNEVKAEMAALLSNATETVFTDGEMEVRPVVKNPSIISQGVTAMSQRFLVSEYNRTGLLALRGVVPFRNGMLHVDNGSLEPITADWNVWWNVPMDWTGESAECPEWLAFLDSMTWGKGTEEYRVLQQWFGYLLSGAMDQQKMLLLVGPTRCGKGTILKIAAALLGDGAVGQRLDALGERFGLAPLLGKSLVTIGDARFENKTDKGLIQTLLSVVGEDEIGVEAKNKDTVSTTLDTRIMMASNEPPRFMESSDALAQRFVVLETDVSFLGREDKHLANRLMRELPGIVQWALEGYRDLRDEGAFSSTTKGTAFIEELIRTSAPIRQFVEERCVLDPEARIPSGELYAEYDSWARSGNYFTVNAAMFSRELHTTHPRIEAGKSNGKRVLKGIRLNPEAVRGGY